MRRRMHPVAGRVGPVVDVRSKAQVKNALDLIKKGPVTLVFIYADWCGHCSHFKPKYLSAVNSPGRTTQAVMVNDAVVSDFNSALSSSLNATPLEVEGYPTTVAMGTNGNVVGEIPPSATTEEITTMATMATPDRVNASTKKGNTRSSNTNGMTVPQSYVPTSVDELGETTPLVVRTNSGNTSIVPTPMANNRTASVNVNAAQPVSPSLADSDMVDSRTPVVQRGGSLYSALASAAYNLAPAGLLLAGLHAVRGRKGGKRSKRTRRTSRR
jgi:hypothetical protein